MGPPMISMGVTEISPPAHVLKIFGETATFFSVGRAKAIVTFMCVFACSEATAVKTTVPEL